VAGRAVSLKEETLTVVVEKEKRRLTGVCLLSCAGKSKLLILLHDKKQPGMEKKEGSAGGTTGEQLNVGP